MKNIVFDSSFSRQLKKLAKKHYPMDEFQTALDLLANDQTLPSKYHDHALSGNYQTCRDCHIQPDWLLIYRTSGEDLILVATGSHDELFK